MVLLQIWLGRVSIWLGSRNSWVGGLAGLDIALGFMFDWVGDLVRLGWDGDLAGLGWVCILVGLEI